MEDQHQDRAEPPELSNEPGPSDRKKRKKNSIGEEEQPSCCALCQEVLMNSVSTSCGHWFCRQCIRSYWDQSVPSGPSSCPQYEERPRTGSERLTANQSSCSPDPRQEKQNLTSATRRWNRMQNFHRASRHSQPIRSLALHLNTT